MARGDEDLGHQDDLIRTDIDLPRDDADLAASLHAEQERIYGWGDDRPLPETVRMYAPPDAIDDGVEASGRADAPIDDDATVAPQPSTVEIPGHLRLAAQGMGWSEQEIDAHVRAVGSERATRDFERYERDIMGYPPPAGEGYPFQGAGVPPVPFGLPPVVPAPGHVQPAPPAGGPPPSGHDGRRGFAGLTDAQIAKAREEYGDEHADNLSLMRDQAIEMESVRTTLAQQAQQRGLETVNRFVQDMATKGYADLFGSDPNRANPDQRIRMQYVIRDAAALVQGAAAQGRHISPEAALARAALPYTRQSAAAGARRQVEQSITQRQSRMTIPPGSRGGHRPRGADPEAQAREAIREWHEKNGLAMPG